MKHSPAFARVRGAILNLDDRDRARLAAMLGAMNEHFRSLGQLKPVLRMIGELDDDDLDRLARWFTTWVNRWGQTPRATSLGIDPRARWDSTELK